MKTSCARKFAVTIQILALVMIQVNTLAPQVARLFPALAVGDLGECHCTLECRCSLEIRRNGMCCCKQMKRAKYKMHCNPASMKHRTVTIGACPCGGSSHITFLSPENTECLSSVPVRTGWNQLPCLSLASREPPPLRDRIPEPPDPPPHTSFLS